MITDDEIRVVLRCSAKGLGVCRRLIKTALEKGGKNNVTVIVIWPLSRARQLDCFTSAGLIMEDTDHELQFKEQSRNQYCPQQQMDGF